MRSPIPYLITGFEKNSRRYPTMNNQSHGLALRRKTKCKDANEIANMLGSSSAEEPPHSTIVLAEMYPLMQPLFGAKRRRGSRGLT